MHASTTKTGSPSIVARDLHEHESTPTTNEAAYIIVVWQGDAYSMTRNRQLYSTPVKDWVIPYKDKVTWISCSYTKGSKVLDNNPPLTNFV